MTVEEAANKSVFFKYGMLAVSIVLVASVLGIILLAILHDPIPAELTATSAASFAYLTGSVTAAGQLK